MALATYSDLKAQILLRALALRDFTDVDVSDFITLAETDVASVLDHYAMQKVVTLITTNNVITLPDDFLELRYLDADGRNTVQVPISGMQLDQDSVGYFMRGNTIVFVPASSTPRTITIEYKASIPPLSDANPTNWLLKKFPAVYLHASLVRAFEFTMDEAGEKEKQRLSDAIAVVNSNNQRGQKVGNPLDWGI